MSEYIHKVNYYETDKMGIVHHSNYIRFMEEARLFYLEKIGFPFEYLESQKLASPVVSVSCDYKQQSTFGDKINIKVDLVKYNGVQLWLNYTMKIDDRLIALGASSHCFVNMEGRPVILKRQLPDFDTALKKELEIYQSSL